MARGKLPAQTPIVPSDTFISFDLLYRYILQLEVDVAKLETGLTPQRLTTAQKNALVSPSPGTIVYDLTLNKLCVRTASAWETITSV